MNFTKTSKTSYITQTCSLEHNSIVFVLLGFTPSKTDQPLRDMELQEKEAQKD